MKFRDTILAFALCLLAEAVYVSHSVSAETTPKRINVTAKRFTYAPAELTLKKGEPVDIVLQSVDVAHGIHFKELNLQAKISKGGTAELAFTPDKVGDFVGHCSVFCGSGHGSMTLTFHVVE